MVILKIVLVGAVLFAFMAAAQDQRWPQRVGVIGTCSATAGPRSTPGGYWYACKEGILNGYPNLEADHCTVLGDTRQREVWQCDEALASLPGA